MLISLFPVVLLTLPAAPVDGIAGPPLTFPNTDPITGTQLQCDRCPPGTFLRARCTSTQKSECVECPSGSFTELWNYIGKCLRCGVCGYNQVVKSACRPDSDCQCECKPGYYMKKFDMCFRHSECQTGQEVLTKGTPNQDTVCRICPNGTYSNIISANHNCTEHKNCHAAGLWQMLRGSTWHDSVCVNCDESSSRDGADYLKEILPAFFVHQKMSIKRLRRILHKLPSDDGKKRAPISKLNLSELRTQINAWVTSATANQIRQLPDILKTLGASSAGERLLQKLQRIDSQMCPLGNEVDVVIISQ